MPRDMRRPSVLVELIILLVFAAPGGALLGVLNLGAEIGRPGYTGAAAIFGGAVGLLTSPAPAFLLRRKDLPRALALVYLPSAAISFVLGFFIGPASAPFVAINFLAMCVIAHTTLSDADPINHDLCHDCRYDLRGLPTRVCPECGLDNASPDALRNPHPDNPYEKHAAPNRNPRA